MKKRRGKKVERKGALRDSEVERASGGGDGSVVPVAPGDASPTYVKKHIGNVKYSE